ncbi:hypothetical protein VKI21_06240 [Cyanobacterium aponinum UTEX 3222]|uniref:Uncharacterized protein n=1 Tax=Cyanobacterium aponinum AL20115 TaxID=3090662 RepID=A0AAF0Z7W2_9CHRO|nr:hypothetical protein [Cyanobacterium aponinum]WPF87886.1 hypothetical protein SAY89_13925 [Cyanobacterium aponinum AL20115]WRL36950.1 hypothetical protein VKI22_09915 [Cyanobacterium aponinum UTEX 3221]WRL43282.1 hypothetical protein VKI21_06240 [Cyanobacterium aponinum UTEX 3222]
MNYPHFFHENFDYSSHKDDQEIMSHVIQNEIGDILSVADYLDTYDQD